MARETSIECYNQIKEEGLLSKMRLKVLEAIVEKEPCTSAEAMVWMGAKGYDQSRARFTELRRFGVIEELGVRECLITGRNAIQWRLTGHLPAAIPKAPKEFKLCKKTGKAIIRQMEIERIIFVEREWISNLINI